MATKDRRQKTVYLLDETIQKVVDYAAAKEWSVNKVMEKLIEIGLESEEISKVIEVYRNNEKS